MSRRSDALGLQAPVLEVDRLAVTYSNGAVGVSDVSLSVHSGRIVAILGRNGAGKTTVLRGISGFLRAERASVKGSVRYFGREIAGGNPVQNSQRGIVLVPERDKVFSSLRVAEHFALVRKHGTPADQTSVFEGLERRRTSSAGLLSGGERQMLALEVALRQQPKLLLVDEMSLGLAPVIVKDLMRRLRELAVARDLAVVVVEQDASNALGIADDIIVIDDGRVAMRSPAGQISAAELGHEYLGSRI